MLLPRVKPQSFSIRQAAGWRVGTRVAFRFCVVYFGLFCLLYPQIITVFSGPVGVVLPRDAALWQMHLLAPVIDWVGHAVFGVDAVLHPDSRSGDQPAMWVLMFTLVITAAVATVLWSVLDRRRTHYPRAHAWFMTVMRICLGGQFLLYGAGKVIPVQMPAPALTTLLRPYGQLSPNWVLWLQVGSSYPYEIAIGAVEITAGLLLCWPRTATLGALLALASMTQVFLLNMTYDVSVKILSFQLLSMAVVLLAPHARRLADMLILHQPSPPATQPTLFTTRRATNMATAVQVGLAVWVLAGALLSSGLDWHQSGGRPKPALYGIWTVTAFTSTKTPPPTTPRYRWQRLIVQASDALTYQQMDGQLVTKAAVIDAYTITLLDTRPPTTLTVTQPGPDQLTLSGDLDGQPVTMTLERVDLNRFPLQRNGFHWVQQYPDIPPEQ